MGISKHGGAKGPKQNFLRDSHGNMALIIGLCALPMMLAGGAALDCARMFTLKSQLDDIAYSVAVQTVRASSRAETDNQAKAEAYKRFETMAAANGYGTLNNAVIGVTTGANHARSVSIYYTASVPASVTSLLGLQKLTVSSLVSAGSSPPSQPGVPAVADNISSKDIPVMSGETAKSGEPGEHGSLGSRIFGVLRRCL